MNSGFINTAPSGLSDSFTADQVVGNRLEVKRDVIVHLRNPGSAETETWKKGFISPPVYSWVQKGGELYWMIGELQPIRYVKHNSQNFDLRPDSGGAQFLKNNDGQGWFSFPFGDFEKNLKDTAKAILPFAAVGLGIYALAPLAPVFIKKIATKNSEK